MNYKYLKYIYTNTGYTHTLYFVWNIIQPSSEGNSFIFDNMVEI